MLSALIEKIGTLFDNLAIPGEIMEVFQTITEIWDAVPLAVRVTLIGCFSVACVLAILKMLF